MCARFRVDYDSSYFAPPVTDAEFVVGALRCADQLVRGYTYAETWPVHDGGYAVPKRQARRAAKHLERALEREQGRDALAVMASGYGRATARLWREAADSGEHGANPESLRVSADASDRLAELVERTWPVRGYHVVLERVGGRETRRMFDVDNPDALVNLRDYAYRMRAVADALAVALFDRFDEFEDAISGPVFAFHMKHNLLVLSDWNFATAFWSNLVSPHPVSHGEVMGSVAEESTGH
jgi:hypothetical protein